MSGESRCPVSSTTKPTADASPPVDISGKVSQVHKATPNWSAGKLRVKWNDVSFSVKGFVKFGEPVTLRGKWVNHPKYGKQFEATEVVYTTPADVVGLKQWLEWYAPGVGPVKAQKLVDEFGMQLIELCSRDPQAVAIFAELQIERVHEVAKAWAEFESQHSTIAALAQFGLTRHQCELIYGRFKGSAVTILKEDPYLLLREVSGMGWKTIDELARKIGFPVDHPGRLRAAVVTAVAGEYDEGSTVVETGGATAKAADLTELPESEYAEKFAVQTESAANKGIVKRLGSDWLALPPAFAHESHLWARLQQSREPNPHTKGDAAITRRMYEAAKDFADRLADNYARLTIGDTTITLDETQLCAVAQSARHRFTFVTGGAGAGKTLVARAITKLFTDANVAVSLCAPTGKAARRLTEVIGREAMTIHRLLGYNPGGGIWREDGYDDNGDKKFTHHPAAVWRYDARYQLPSGVVIVDEASMIDSELWYHLLRACGSNVAIVAIGDPNQLPPVGAGSMLRDVIQLDLAPVAKLGHCHRQAGPLKVNCNAILEGRVEPSVEGEPSPWMVHRNLLDPAHITKAVVKLFEVYLPQWGYDPVADTQFLTARHAGPLGTTHLNKVCQYLRQKALGNDLGGMPRVGDEERAVLHAGDKVMHTKNNYTLGVMNGTQGVVIDTHPQLVVEYDDKTIPYPSEFKSEVSLAYVITPHKAQGSEWPCAVVVTPKQHSFMQTRSWLYTACTRAKKTCVIIGDEDGVRRAAEKEEVDKRRTCLEVFAKNEGARP